MNSTITILMEMASNQNSLYLKSFHSQNEVLMEMNTHTWCKRSRIELTVEPIKFYLKICQTVSSSPHRYVENSKAVLRHVFKKLFFLFQINVHFIFINLCGMCLWEKYNLKTIIFNTILVGYLGK